MNNPKNIPQHVAIIMDGNGRWAKSRGLHRIAGHRAGIKSAREVIRAAGEIGINTLTLYTFSTENWKRPKNEIDALFGLLERYLDREEDKLNKNNIRFNVIGDIAGLPDGVRKKIIKVMESTKTNSGIVLNLALNYGSRSEIINAVRKISQDALSKKINPEDIDEELFSSYLYTAGQHDPDLLIRTSGEYRVSNFLLWQISYAELYVTKKLWPDFGKEDLKKAVAEYERRERRFGG